MKLKINEVDREFDSQLTVTQLLEKLDLAGKPVAVELNLEIVPQDEQAETKLNDGDQLEIVSLTGGG